MLSLTRLRRRFAAALVVAVVAALPVVSGSAQADVVSSPAVSGGYWMVASDGGIFAFGGAPFYGSTGDVKLNQPIVGMAATPTGKGYWFVAADGGIFSFGDAQFYGSTGGVKLNKPIVGMAPTPSGQGYWFVASDGGIFSFGDAKFYGSTGGVKLNKPIVGMAPTPSGQGYWFVASDGGIFSFGDAKFYGSTGNVKLAKPITAMATSPSGNGYWFTASDGGIFTFGDAKFYGAGPGFPVPAGGRNVNAMVPSPDGSGYWMASASGELLAFGNAGDMGGLGGSALAKPIVGMAALPAGRAGPTGTNSTGTNPTDPGPSGPTTNTATPTTGTTGTTIPPYTGPMKFSSSALKGWGTPSDTEHSRQNSAGDTVYPYSQKVVTIAEVGNKVFVGGYFKDLHQNDSNKTPTPSGVPGGRAYLAELDTDGNVNPSSPFNSTVRLDGPVRALYTDGQRLYVGGEFRKVNGSTRPYLVALNPSTGGIDPTFNPPAPDRYVNTITGYNGRIFVAGAYTMLNSTPKYQLAAFDAATGNVDTGFIPPARTNGKFVGHTGKRIDDPLASDPNTPDPNGSIETMLVVPDGRSLLLGGSFLHFGFDHAADPGHKHSGLIAIDITTGGLCGAAGVQCTWQPEQSSNSSRPIFDIAAYRGDPKAIGINASQLIFTASGGAGGRVIAWTPGGKTTQLWRGNMDGDVMSVAVTQDRVYVVGHFDHTVADPNDPCLEIDPATGGVHCDDGTANRHLAAFFASGEIVNGKNTGKSLIDSEFRAQADTSEGPYVVTIGTNRMYVGGNFTDIANFPVRQSCPYPQTAQCVQVRQPGFAVYPPAQ